MKISNNVSIDEGDQSQFKLPSLVNPRDARMIMSLNRRSIDRTPERLNDQSSVSIKPFNKEESLYPITVKPIASSLDVRKQALLNLNKRIDEKHIRRYHE